jgi:hypothetical protein
VPKFRLRLLPGTIALLAAMLSAVHGENGFSSFLVIGSVSSVNTHLRIVCVKQASIGGYTESFIGCYRVAPGVTLGRVRRGDSILGIFSRDEDALMRLRVKSRHDRKQ